MRSRRSSCCLLLALILLSLSACGHAATSTLAVQLDQLLGDSALRYGTKGIIVKSLDSGRVLYERNADVLFAPASCFKVLVTSTALDTLGPNFKIQTCLYTTAKPSTDGTISGDLVLVGKGDPVFKLEDLQAMADWLKSSGVKSIKGNIVGDDTWFDDNRLGIGWSWDYEAAYYSAQISGLNLNENVVDVWVRPGAKVGSPATIKTNPSTNYVSIKNDCRTVAAGSEKTLVVDRIHGKNIIHVTGNIPIDYNPSTPEESITVESPTLFASHVMMEMLKRNGIEVRGQPTVGKLPDGAQLLLTHDSPPISEMLALCLKPSDNLIAECLLKTLGAQAKGIGSTQAGEGVELDFLKKIGGDATGIVVVDGCGLSRLDCITPRNLLTIMSYMSKHKDSKVYSDALPIAGVDGTMKKRLQDPSVIGNVHAKDGYLTRVSTICGYVKSKGGETLVFSIMMNNHLCKYKEVIGIQDKMVEALAKLEK